MEKILGYVAEKVINDLRNGDFVGNDLAYELNKQPYIESLRLEVEAEDVDRIMDVLSGDIEIFQYRLAINLLRRHEKDASTKKFFREQWGKYRGFDRRCTLMWRLLDDENLEVDKHQEIYEFVQDNRENWIKLQCDWIGGPDKIIPFVEKAIVRSDEVESKKWALLYNLLASSDKAAARKVVEPFKSSDTLFLKKVANDIWEQL